ncbi:MAG: MerR family transcriptional regulator [Candidatus Nitrohelix vancouverensis]|uniref:MerR family transcriptional regulator n=1 Tax=Candidatus Nitrohelix vancouverensis TaxID=2705534 RepID=A0A7T0C398_9BACT|nr:MAG: MerR family transcriptional regulator [Candidatus Nitrohelix vancouverensis]
MDTYKIDHVARLTGLTKHVIRSWERRFDLLKPERGDNRYRMYSQTDVDLLLYIKDEIDKGFAIGELASLGRERLLEQMIAKKSRPDRLADKPLDRIHDMLIASLVPFDKAKFIQIFNESVALLSFNEVFYKIFLPLQRKVGDLWHEETIGVAQEHFVSNLIRQKFLSVLNHLPVSNYGPKVVVSCLPDDNHEIGAWMAAYQCAINGCQVYYLGANMPVKELGAFCTLIHPNLVLLACTGITTEAEAKLLAEKYERLVLPVCPVWAGGRSMDLWGRQFMEKGIDVLDSLHILEDRLKRLSHFLNLDRSK